MQNPAPKFFICSYSMPNLPLKRAKVSGQRRALGPIFDWDVKFEKLTVQMCLGLGPNYLTRIDHHGK